VLLFKKSNQMTNINQTLETAQTMFLHGSRRKEVIDFLLANGVSQEEVDTVATNAYLSIKDQRQEILETYEEQTEGGGTGASAIIGALLLFGGIIATMATDRIWYGAMIVGLIMIVKGLRS
jgi:hypothetical protein